MESEKAWETLIKKEHLIKKRLDWKPIGEGFHIYELLTNADNKQNWKHKLLTQPGVRYVEEVSEATPRSVEPNDELFSEQWALPLIGAPQAWLELDGAMTAEGDEIVIAVLDNGFLVNHLDLRDQVWTNPHEIPNNGIDDDNNGYVDDVNGWNFRPGIPLHEDGFHGTPVAGILGASTNNNLGIAGVAYDTKLMPLTPSLATSEIYSALMYAHEQRKRYNESQGREGSFVVAANLSFGFDFNFPDDFPIFCELFDSLAHVGIIPVVSTTNAAVDIEIEGEMPGLCGASTQITVTKTNRRDEKDSNEGGFGSTFVHLGAPGQSIQSTTSNGVYGEFNGTSASAPFVSGTIALLYSSPCVELAQGAIQQPLETALKVKELLLNSTKSLPSLESITVSGGRLDIFEAMRLASVALCERDSSFITETGNKLRINQLYPNPNGGTVYVNFTPESLNPIALTLMDMSGKVLHERKITLQIFENQGLQFELPASLFSGTYIVQLSQDGSIDQSLLVYSP